MILVAKPMEVQRTLQTISYSKPMHAFVCVPCLFVNTYMYAYLVTEMHAICFCWSRCWGRITIGGLWLAGTYCLHTVKEGLVKQIVISIWVKVSWNRTKIKIKIILVPPSSRENLHEVLVAMILRQIFSNNYARLQIRMNIR